MNILFYSSDPNEASLYIDDIRKNKLLTESGQMLSTAMNILNPHHGMKVYKSTHPNHPSNVWARSSRANFEWLLHHMYCMHRQRRTPHATAELIPTFKKFLKRAKFPEEGLTAYANCARHRELLLDFTHIDDVFHAYRLYSCARWELDTIKLSWNNGSHPSWRKKLTPLWRNANAMYRPEEYNNSRN